jgi:hypothetical protein
VLALVLSVGINLYVGDVSAALGYVSDPTSEQARIRGHLMFAHDVLAAADMSKLSPELRAARATNLDRLRRYALAGQFPRNDDHPDPMRPTFVDNRGEICAVGALYAGDRGYPAAVRVAERYKYAYVVQIDDPDLRAWQATSGLSRAELALIQPAYDREPPPRARMRLPWGLTDRAQYGATRVSLGTELTSADAFATTAHVAHVQAPFPGGDRTSFYVTLPFGLVLDTERESAARGPLRDAADGWFGNADLGVYFGPEWWTGEATIVRIGALLPTATAPEVARPPSMRVGDLVFELPPSYGARFAVSHLSPWLRAPPTWFGGRGRLAIRAEGGVDVAHTVTGEISYAIPRAALGLLIAGRYANVSIDTVAANAQDLGGDSTLRWSTGATVRYADGDDPGFLPALTFAAVRTPTGWGGVVALELAFARPR